MPSGKQSSCADIDVIKLDIMKPGLWLPYRNFVSTGEINIIPAKAAKDSCQPTFIMLAESISNVMAATYNSNLPGWNFLPKYHAYKLIRHIKPARSMLAPKPVIAIKTKTNTVVPIVIAAREIFPNKRFIKSANIDK